MENWLVGCWKKFLENCFVQKRKEKHAGGGQLSPTTHFVNKCPVLNLMEKIMTLAWNFMEENLDFKME